MTIKTEDGDKLLLGIRSRDVAMVREALSEGFDPNEADLHGWTAFHEAVATGSSSITLAFLRRGASPDLQDHLYRNSSLHLAAEKGHTKIVQMLLDNSANINLKNSDGKTPEEVATSACKELLQRKRIELLMRTGTNSLTKSYKDGSVLKFCPARSASPGNKQGSTSASSESTSSIDCKDNTSPGEIKLSFDHNRRQICLKVNILEIKDLKLPKVHNYGHIYVKCNLIPDKDNETKGTTSTFKVASDDEGYMSRGSSASSQSSTGSFSSLDFDSQIADKIMSVLKKTSKKNKDEVKCMLHSEGDAVGRVSISIYETLTYDSLVLRKLNNIMSEAQVHVRVCGRNRWSSKSAVIAEATIPLAIALKKNQVPQSFCLNYKIEVPVTPEEKKLTQMNQSWELKEGRKYTGRSLAWNMDLAPECTAATMYNSPSVPDLSATKKHRKHPSKAARLLKGEFKLFKGKQNDRYKRNAKRMDDPSVNNPRESQSAESACSDEVEYIGPEKRESSDNSLSNSTDIEHQHWRVSKSVDNVFEITNKAEESTAAQPSLKYSRAFGNQATGRSARRTHDEDVSLEDIDDDFDQDFKQSPIKLRARACRS